MDTKLAQLIDPEVMGQMISAALPNAIRFEGVAPLDTTLVGQPGSTITLPSYKYIGDAKVVAEGIAIDYSKLETKSAPYSIEKIAKGVSLTDEAMLSGYGDPVGEAVSQITKSIASTLDNKTLEALKTTTLSVDTEIAVAMIDKIEGIFNDEDDSTGVLFLNPKDASKLRAEAALEFVRASDLGDNIIVKGVFGEILGWSIVRTNKITEGEGLAVKAGAAKTFIKRGVNPETARDIDRKLNKFNADQHFVVGLVDETKVVKITIPIA